MDLQDIVRCRYVPAAPSGLGVRLRKTHKLELYVAQNIALVLHRETESRFERRRPSSHQRLAWDRILPHGGEIDEGNGDAGGTVYAGDPDGAGSASPGATGFRA